MPHQCQLYHTVGCYMHVLKTFQLGTLTSSPFIWVFERESQSIVYSRDLDGRVFSGRPFRVLEKIEWSHCL